MTPAVAPGAVAASVSYLESDEAAASLALSAYWPKWHSPWWHMLLLWELGLAERIPARAARGLVDALHRGPQELGPGPDAPCHCQLGTVYRVLAACGVDVDAELPWIRPWFLRYQLPDGGLNCDESARLKSSIVSTLPPLEAVLSMPRRSPEEEAFLDRGAAYLIAHKLVRSSDGTRLINPDWLKLCFPRFYEYDIARGLDFLRAYCERRGRALPFEDVPRELGRDIWRDAKTLLPDGAGGWTRGHRASGFELLQASSYPQTMHVHSNVDNF